MQIFKTPLNSWLIAFSILIILPLAQHFNGGILSVTPKHQSGAADKKPHGLLITSSGLHCALQNVSDIERESRVVLQSIYQPLASIWSFPRIEKIINKADPDFIVLQGSLLANNRKTSNIRTLVRQLKQYWIMKLSQLHPVIERKFINLQCALHTLDHDKWDHWVKAGLSSKATNAKNLSSQAGFLNTLLRFDKPVIIISQPHPAIAQHYKHKVAESVSAIIQFADSEHSVKLADYQTLHPDTLFYDPYHPNTELSQIFSRWFHEHAEGLIAQ